MIDLLFAVALQLATHGPQEVEAELISARRAAEEAARSADRPEPTTCANAQDALNRYELSRDRAASDWQEIERIGLTLMGHSNLPDGSPESASLGEAAFRVARANREELSGRNDPVRSTLFQSRDIACAE